MCGIIHCKKTNKNESAKKLVIKRYEKQKTRGTQGYGYVELKAGYVVAIIRTQTEKEIMEKLEKSTADEILFHHRTPTSTPNIIESTHPILVSNKSLKYNYYVVHNGMISNDDTLRDEHIKQGFEYTTDLQKQYVSKNMVYNEAMIWNDSESVAIDLCQAIETGKEMTSKGSIAIIALQFEKTTGKAIALYFGRNNGNPLKIENDKNFFSLSSETGKDLKTDNLYRFDYATNKITEEVKKIGDYITTYATDYGYGRYDYIKKEYVFDDDEEIAPSKKKDKQTLWEEEEDFEMEEWEETLALEEEIENALASGDTNLAEQLEEDLECLREEIETRKQARIYGREF